MQATNHVSVSTLDKTTKDNTKAEISIQETDMDFGSRNLQLVAT